MGFQAWNLFADFQYRRELQAWHDEEDALEAEEADRERREEMRYAGDDTRLPLMPGAGRSA